MRLRILATAAAGAAALISVLATSAPANATSTVHFTKIQYNSPGPDNGSPASLNAEYVTIKNTRSTSVSLQNWTVRDRVGHVYTFPAFTLGAWKSVVVHTGKGTNTATNLYWGRTAYVWNNTGDAATLRNSGNTTFDSCRWGNGPGYIYC
ncbi:MAG: lamin tail domain-containing protein [Actinocatenispora sp.]